MYVYINIVGLSESPLHTREPVCVRLSREHFSDQVESGWPWILNSTFQFRQDITRSLVTYFQIVMWEDEVQVMNDNEKRFFMHFF